MHRFLTPESPEAVDGRIDLDFRDPSGWPPQMDGAGLGILFGDDDAGPFVFLSAFPPMEEQMPLSFAHAHASDNWRISIRGTTNMGRDAYETGEFRFHDGGVPYASDNYAWGPDGGFGLIMFGDRRGFPIKPVKASIAEKLVPGQLKLAEAIGIDVADPCPGAPAIATTFGPTERGHRDDGFGSAASWTPVGDGVRAAAGLLGEPTCGPAILLLDADPGAEVLPARTLDTEVLIAPVAGATSDADGTLDQGAVRLELAGREFGPLVAGDDGAQVVVIVGDRRALPGGALGPAIGDLLDPLTESVDAA